MPQGWESNRRSGVTLAMRHGLKWFIHLRAQRPRVKDEHPAYAPAGAWLPLPFTYIKRVTGMNPTKSCLCRRTMTVVKEQQINYFLLLEYHSVIK